MSSVGHVHAWGRKRYVDRCHYTDVERACPECGTTRVDPTERNFDLNPEQVVFADEDCRRCRELLAAADCWPASWGAMI